MSFIRSGLVALLSKLEGFCQVVMEFINVSSKLMSVEQSNIVLRMDVKCWVVSLVGKEGGNTG